MPGAGRGERVSRFSFARPERLTTRLAVGITLLVILPLAAGLYALSRHQYETSIEQRHAAAELENRILAAALRHQMLRRDRLLMTEILREVSRQADVRRAAVIDHEGVVRLSSREADVGVRLPRDSPTCLACHVDPPQVRGRWIRLEEEGGAGVLRSVLPIENEPRCHACHHPANRLNGMLLLDVSLAPIQARLQEERRRMTFGAGILTVVLLGGVGLLVRRQVLTRLSRLGRVARAFGGGALGVRADTGGGDMIAALARDFNQMADATSMLIGEVKASEQQMAGVLNSLDDGLVVLDRDFRVVAANRSIAHRVCGHPDSLRGASCRDAVGHALPCSEDGECPTARCLTTGKLQRATYSVPDGSGGRVQEVYASPVFAEDGAVARVVEVWRDITERVREEERLAEIERLSSLGVLASGLSHEVNTPLAITLTCAEAILDRLEDVGRAGTDGDALAAIQDSAQTIKEQVGRCRSITTQFLRFARGVPPAVEPLDLPGVVSSVISLARPTAQEAGISLELEGDLAVPLVSANTEVVQHVVLNLLVNAIQSYERPGGRIVARFVVDPEVRLQIEDDGSGIAPEVQKHLFEPLRTHKPRGTGLGLFLSRNFMRRFGGDVRLVHSAVGRGSCIEIVFQRAQADPA